MRAPDFWYNEHPGFGARAICAALWPLSLAYDAAGALKERGARPFDPGIPVVCVGNLTAGGTGKTPTAIAIARLLADRGPFLLTRGYGGSLKGPARVDPEEHTSVEVGDEALLLARAAPTIVARERPLGANVARGAGAGLIIMDDGHQNFTLRKTLSIVVVDGAMGFGNGAVIPAGPLRERPGRGLARADALLVMGEAGASASAAIAGFGGPVFHASLQPDRLRLPDGPLFAFAGIGRPAKFFAMLREAGCDLVGTRAFDDHHPYDVAEITDLRDRARHMGARLVTTEKDMVRIPTALTAAIIPIAVTATIAGEATFRAFLAERLPEPAPAL